MPADQIFVLVLVIGIALGLGWVSLDSRRHGQVERKQAVDAAAGVGESRSPDAVGSTQTPNRPRGKRYARR